MDRRSPDPAPPRSSEHSATFQNFTYDLVLWLFNIILDLFFREIHPRSSWRVPRQGPVLFVAAPHANQVSAPQRCVAVLMCSSSTPSF
jgi:glycerol-3-phosphate O-acyltransferase/dihydroxyacetone phosphate acyltransferase